MAEPRGVRFGAGAPTLRAAWMEEDQVRMRRSLTCAIPIGVTDRDGGPTILDPAVIMTAPLKRIETLARSPDAVETWPDHDSPVGLRFGSRGGVRATLRLLEPSLRYAAAR